MKPSKTTKYSWKYFVLTAVITAAAAVITVCSVTIRAAARDYRAAQAEISKNNISYSTSNSSISQGETGEIPQSSASSDDELYVIKIYDGKIAVFTSGASTPYYISDIRVYLLPEEDISILRKGIYAKSRAEVNSILEDYK